MDPFENNSRFNADKAWEQVSRKVAHKQKVRVIKIASGMAAVLILALMVVPYIIKEQKHLAQVPVNIAAGTKKATLHLASGNTIIITDPNKNNLDSIKEETQFKKLALVNSNVEEKQNKLEIPRGGEYYFELPDGTKVWLNSETTLTFPTSFDGDKREVYLNGQGYFEVQHDAEHPFIVHTQTGQIRVLGTSFDLKAYPADHTLETTLVEGSVKMDVENHPTEYIKPGERVVFTEASDKIQKEKVDVLLYTSWKNGEFRFEEKHFSELAQEISRWYDVDIEFIDSNASEVKYTGLFEKDQSLQNLLQLLERTGNISYSIENRKVIIKSN